MFILLYDTLVNFLLLLLLAVPSSPKELTIRRESRPVRTHGPFFVNVGPLLDCERAGLAPLMAGAASPCPIYPHPGAARLAPGASPDPAEKKLNFK